MFVNAKNFLKNDCGSVTTDWVVLVASLILLSVLVMASVTGAAVNLSAMSAG